MTTRHVVKNAVRIHTETFNLAYPKSSQIQASFLLSFNHLALANVLWLRHCDQTLNYFLSKWQALSSSNT